MNTLTTTEKSVLISLTLSESVVMYWWFAYGYFYSQKPAHL